ncbi:GDCSH [Symbiodinium microadriaticum]|nr:GDCSH [Symbiodinium microadriaticum]
MGWTWALFFANETVASIVRETCEGHGCEMREKLPVPQLWDSPTITSTYVDNVAIIGARKKDVENRAQRINEAFEQKGIPIVWSYTSPVRRLETVGCCIDFEKKTLENKAARLWRVYLAGLELVKRSKVRGKVVQVWLGHVTAIFRFSPYLLSIFDKIYRFTMITEDKRVSLWPAVRAEIQNACDLIWFARVDLGAGYISHVDMGDSADKGYALMSRSASTSLIRAACCFREKWRYVSLPDSLKELVEKVGVSREDVYDFGRLESTMRSTWSGATLSGVGLGTQYSQWLQEALQEGSWLKTSPLMSQYRAKRSMRVDVDCPALVPPLDPELLSEGTFKLLWAKRWKNPEEHIGMKEGRVALSSLKRSARVLSLCGKRKLTICDNLPVVIFFEKGRSSRPGPNRLCRISAAIQAIKAVLENASDKYSADAAEITWALETASSIRGSLKRLPSDSTPKRRWRQGERVDSNSNINAKPCNKKLLKKRELSVEAAVPPHKRLRASKVKPTTLKLYHNAVVEFEEWAADRALNLGSHKEIDEALVEFLHELCEDSRNISDANYTIFGYILLKSNFHMQDRDQLPFAKQAMKGWRARFPAKSRTGVDLRLWDLVALHCFRLGFIDSAAAILIQGDSYLRPNEVLSIRRDCVVPPSSSTLSEIWGVVICPFEEGVPTKSGEFDDTILFDTKERMDVNVIMKCLYRASRGHDYLFENLSYKDYVSHVKKASEHVRAQTVFTRSVISTRYKNVVGGSVSVQS